MIASGTNMASSTFYNDIEVKGIIKTSLAGKSIGTVTSMPAASAKNNGCAVLYTGTSGTYVPGTIYVSDGTSWSAWGKIVTVDESVVSGSTNPVAGGAVYTQLGTKQATVTGAATTVTSSNLTANRALISNSNGKIAVSAVTSTELSYLDGVTSNVQTQLNNKLGSTAKAASATTADSATKATQDGSGNVITSTYATKAELNNSIASVYRYKGSVATYANLPTGATTGDVYNVEAAYDKVPAGTNWAWNGSTWDALAGSVDLTGYVPVEAGKGLSSNDFTDALKKKLDGITDSADSVSFSRSLTSGTKIGTITINGTATDLYCQTNSDTKNTAGSSDTSSKIYLVGATSQASSATTYSHDTAYVGTDGKLYSGGKVVIASGDTATAATKATQDGSGNVITSTYETKANAITGLSVSGKTITYTKGDGSTGTITTQDTNTDTKVTQNASTADGEYPILLKYSKGSSAVTNTAKFGASVTVNPSTSAITATTFIGALSGNASSATIATQDGNGNVIADTYAKAVTGSSLAVSWASDTTVSGYSYKGTITLAGVTANHVPVVTFDPTAANSGKYCPIAESGAGVVYIWGTTNASLTVQSVVAVLP